MSTGPRPLERTLSDLADAWCREAAEMRAAGHAGPAAALVRAAQEVHDALATPRPEGNPPVAPLPADRLWTIGQAADFFGMGEGWVRAHVPAVILPGQGERRAVRFLPTTCQALAKQFQTSQVNTEHAA